MRVVIAGGGVAGLETLLALRVLAGRRVDVTLVAPNAEFTIRANTVGEPFDRAQERRLGVADVAHEHDATLVRATLRSVAAGGPVSLMKLSWSVVCRLRSQLVPPAGHLLHARRVTGPRTRRQSLRS